MGFDPNEARDPAGKWTRLASAILKTASNLRDTARVSQEGHTIYTRKAADSLEKAAHQIFAGDNDRAAELLQAAHDKLKQGHPRHRELAAIKSHMGAHESFTGGKRHPSYPEKRADRAAHESFHRQWADGWQRGRVS
jgi:hypothetical protein